MTAVPPSGLCPSCHRPTGLAERPGWYPRCPHCGRLCVPPAPNAWPMVALFLVGQPLLIGTLMLVHTQLPRDRQALPMFGLQFFLGAGMITLALLQYRRSRGWPGLVNVGIGLLWIGLAALQLADGVGW